MSQITRQPGTRETEIGRKEQRLIEEIYEKPEPGTACQACGHQLDLHSDADCIVPLTNVIKRMRQEIDRLNELLLDR